MRAPAPNNQHTKYGWTLLNVINTGRECKRANIVSVDSCAMFAQMLVEQQHPQRTGKTSSRSGWPRLCLQRTGHRTDNPSVQQSSVWRIFCVWEKALQLVQHLLHDHAPPPVSRSGSSRLSIIPSIMITLFHTTTNGCPRVTHHLSPPPRGYSTVYRQNRRPVM